jgi:mannose-6-phosphate isomerase-like protein (cupin superfamily)
MVINGSVIFYVLQGNGIITIDTESAHLKPHSLIIGSPATISMKSEEGMKLPGIQIVGKES